MFAALDSRSIENSLFSLDSFESLKENHLEHFHRCRNDYRRAEEHRNFPPTIVKVSLQLFFNLYKNAFMYC